MNLSLVEIVVRTGMGPGHVVAW